MDHLTNTIAQADPTRLAKAAQGLADNTLTVAVVFQADDEVRAIVKNGDDTPYTTIITEGTSLCACKDFLYRSHTVGPCKHIAALALFAIQNPPTRLTPTEAARCSADAELPAEGETAEQGTPSRPTVVRLRKFREHVAA